MMAPTKAPLRFPQSPDHRDDEGLDNHGRSDPGATTRTGVPRAPPRAASMAPENKDPGEERGNVDADGTGHLPV